MLRLCSYACAYVALYVAGVTAFFVLPYAYATSVNQAWRRAYARNVKLYFLYRQYTNLFIFWSISKHCYTEHTRFILANCVPLSDSETCSATRIVCLDFNILLFLIALWLTLIAEHLYFARKIARLQNIGVFFYSLIILKQLNYAETCPSMLLWQLTRNAISKLSMYT